MTVKKIEDGEQNDGLRDLRVQLRGQLIGEFQTFVLFEPFFNSSQFFEFICIVTIPNAENIGHKNP